MKTPKGVKAQMIVIMVIFVKLTQITMSQPINNRDIKISKEGNFRRSSESLLKKPAVRAQIKAFAKVDTSTSKKAR